MIPFMEGIPSCQPTDLRLLNAYNRYMQSAKPKLSLIIASHDPKRIDDLLSLLHSVKCQSYENMETIVVIDNSIPLFHTLNDRLNTPEIGVFLQTNKRGLSACRNLGIEFADGDILAFVDDDIMLPQDWAQKMVESYEDTNTIGVTGSAIPLWDKPEMNWLPKELYWLISCTAWTGWDEPKEVPSAWGMNMSFRREAFKKCGLFNEDTGYHRGLVAEDIDFSYRVRRKTGKQIWFFPQIRVFHRVYPYRLSHKYIRERSTWIGQSHRAVKKFYGDTNTLSANENTLLSNITKKLLPAIAKRLLTEPRKAFKQLTITLTALSYIGYGYYTKRRF